MDLIKREDARNAVISSNGAMDAVARVNAIPAETAEVAPHEPRELFFKATWKSNEGYVGWWIATDADGVEVAMSHRLRPFARIAAQAVADVRERALREAAWKATSFLVGDPTNGVPLRNPMAHEVADAILALIEEPQPTEYERKVAQMKEDFPNGI